MFSQSWRPGQSSKLVGLNPAAPEFKHESIPTMAKPNINLDDLSNYVAIDVEHTPVVGGYSWPTQVSIVDGNLKTLLNEYIVMEKTPIVEISKKRVQDNIQFKRIRKFYADVKPQITSLLKDKIVVGHDLIHDFKVLGLNTKAYKTIDTATLPFFMQTKRVPQKLRNLAKQYLHVSIQQGIHDSLIDARTTMDVFLTFKDKDVYKFPYPHNNIERSIKILKEAEKYGLTDKKQFNSDTIDDTNLLIFPKPMPHVNYTANLEQVFPPPPPNPRGKLITKYMANIYGPHNLLGLNEAPLRNHTRRNRYRYEQNLEGLFPAKPKSKWQSFKNIFSRKKTRRRM